ncbi:MAG: hypothetical protein RMI94_10685 [Bryobacterales bacterium]|nr:hypothetical protein [Bryobacteraceae bacterium]MDW8131006.1 hypothetical protein [Bryobacterales bacterium]
MRWFPSLTDVAFLLPLVLLFVRLDGARTMLGDGDTGWHLRTGEWILAHGRVPDRDIFSFTKSGEPWYAWEWLWDVLFGWLHLNWGLPAVVFASSLVLALTFALLYRLVLRACDHEFVAVAVTVVACCASALHWLARPHLFTLLFLVLFLSILRRVREGRTRLLAWLPLLMILWTNLHGGFIAGILLILTYAAGEAAHGLVEADGERRRDALRRAWPYFLAAIASLAASFMNPYGYRLHLHIWRYLRDPFLYRTILEYQPANFQRGDAIFFEFLLLAGALAAWRSLRRREFTTALLYLFWGHLALFAVRNIPIFAIVIAAPAAVALREALEELAAAAVRERLRRWARSFLDAAAEFAQLDRLPRLHAASVAAALAIAALLFAPGATGKFRSEYDHKRYPARAIETLGAEAFADRVFTHDEWGDYLIYRLYPKGKAFVDGRSDFYGSRFNEAFLNTMNARWGWEQHLEKYGIETVLLPVDAPLAGALKASSAWRVVYDDGIAIVFRRAREPQPSSIVSAGDGTDRDRRVSRPDNFSQPETQSRRRSDT